VVVEELEVEPAPGDEAELEAGDEDAGPLGEDAGPLGEDDEEDEAESGESGESRLEQDPETIARAREVLARLIEPLDPLAQVAAQGGAQGIVLEIDSKEAGVLIGRRGQHLEALQYIATRIVSHQAGRPVRLSVDAGGYRQRRREALEELAQRAGAKAKATGKSVSIGPLSAPERRVVHMTLKAEPGVTTTSRGRGELKKVIVSAR
jgi:spoIIIJ-associated protein